MKNTKSHYSIGFIGLGRMAGVILRALLSAKLAKPSQILVCDKFQHPLKKVAKPLKIATTTDSREIAKKCTTFWLGVKPHQASQVLKEIRPWMNAKHTVLSMMAGISTRFLRRHLGPGPKIIRLMPNTPALLGEGATGVYFPANISRATHRQVSQILQAMGEVEVVRREKDLDAITGLSGSGPAFVYAFAQGLVRGGVQSKLSPRMSQDLAIQTLLGAAKMLKETKEQPKKLIQQVVSKGGTTEAGLKVLKQKKLIDSVAQAVNAATHRAKTICEENEKCIP